MGHPFASMTSNDHMSPSSNPLMTMVPPWAQVVLTKLAVAGERFEAVKLPPNTSGYPPVSVTVTSLF